MLAPTISVQYRLPSLTCRDLLTKFIAMDLVPLSRRLDGGVSRLTWIMAISVIFMAVLNTFRSYMRLRHIPGPRLAAQTNLVRRSWVTTGDAHQIHTDLHRQYGTVVRFGPNAVMVSQPKAIDKIYGFKIRFPKACHISLRFSV